MAGTAPDRRPDAAPRITAFVKPAGWSAKALAGVEQPAPPSLRWLDSQGAWYTPFDRPGMPGPYDIRSLHAAGKSAQAQPQPQPGQSTKK